jgi:archaemetzincin
MKKLFLLLSITTLISCSNDKKTLIGIQPFNDFPKAISDSISSAIKNVYQFETVQLQQQQLPKVAFINIKSPRYRADSLLKFLKRNKPDSISYILGLTTKDISTTKRDKDGSIKEPLSKYTDWGVFGLGYRPGPSSIVSTFRYKTNKRSLFIERLQKICVHELGHNLGLTHCTSGLKCVMQDAAETIKTVDNVEMKLCISCKKQLKSH